MAAVAVRHGRSLRSGRLRGRHESGEETVRLDFGREPCENVKEILSVILCQHGISKTKKLGYLNCFVKLLQKLGTERNLGYSSEEILCCLRLGLLHDAKEVRAATLRVIRYLLPDKTVLDAIVGLHIDYLIARCLDICLSNEVERIHAMKLIRKIIQLYPHQVPLSLLYPLVAIGNDGACERDRLRRTCLATICELAFYNAEAADRCNGISCLLRNILDCYHYPRINESLVVTILYLLNHPQTRHYIKQNTDLEQLIAPFTDHHFKFSGDMGDDRETRFIASKMAITTVIRSWPGLIRMCRPTGSGLQSLIGILYIQNSEIRQGIMDVIYDLFRLTVPKWTENFFEALASVDPSGMKEEWRLMEGFVAEEGRSILPHMAKTRPNLVENHLALILLAWIEGGIFEALVEVITSTEDNLFVRAVILLGELLHMANTLLPHECNHHSHCLPDLMALASSFGIPGKQRHRATLAITCLNKIHAMKKRGPIPCSLYLDYIIQNANYNRPTHGCQFHFGKDRLLEMLKATVSSDELVSQVVRDSQVLTTKDNMSWNWDFICTVLKCPDEKFKKLDDQNSLRFIRRLIFFFKPSNRLFSSVEQSHKFARKLALAGCHLVDFLLDTDGEEVSKLVNEWLTDIAHCLTEVKVQRAPGEAILSPANINTNLSHYYFLFIGRFSSVPKGEVYLEKSSVFQCLHDLISITSHDTYIRLTVSSLYYGRDSSTRAVLTKGLVASSENARLYATRFLRVLLRSKIQSFKIWGMEMVVTQLYDQSRSVAMAALNVVDEACELQENLEVLIKFRPSVLHLGEKGTMLICRFLSHPRGFKSLKDANYVNNELQKWHKTFNVRYVKIVEELLNEALTTYERNYEGSFTRRTSQKRPKKDVYLPIHLYGQLTQHKEGFQLLETQECIQDYFHCIKCQALHNDDDLLKLKTALWAVGHIGSSSYGVSWLKEEHLVTEIIRLAEECGVFSVRGTAFYVLGLIASTRQGAELLAQYGWEALWHNRLAKWPIVESREQFASFPAESPSENSLSVSSGTKSDFEQLSVPHLERFGLDGHCPEERDDRSHKPYNKPRHIPVSAKDDSDISLHKLTAINRSSTLPPRSSGFDRSHSAQFCTTKSKSMHGFIKEKTLLSPVNSGNLVPMETKFSGMLSLLADRPENKSTSKSSHVSISVSHSGDRISNQRIADNKTDTISELTVSSNTPPMENSSSRIFEYRYRIGSLREQYSGSDSSKTSKSRADSFNTDSTTSGVSSCDSGPTMTCDTMCLSPIAGSTTTIPTTTENTATPIDIKDYVHPSTQQRRLVNLSRVPSLRRHCGSPPYGILPSCHGLDHIADNPITYTSTRDAVGFATLRLIRRQRTSSSDVDSDYGLSTLYGEDETFSRSCSIGSQKSDAYRDGILRNMSLSSLQDYDLQHSSPSNAQLVTCSVKKVGCGEPEFIGLCLPVDINMIFEVNEGEDRRSNSISSARSTNSEKAEGDIQTNGGDERMEINDDDDDKHLPHNCMMCCRVHRIGDGSTSVHVFTELDDGSIPPIDSDAELSTSNTICQKEMDGNHSHSPADQGQHKLPSHSRSHEPSWATPGSITSNASTDSSSRRLTDDNLFGKTLIRKEILRFVVNLSSSVGVKSSEQGLLSLKQKFPKAFQDLCFYSDVSHLMSNYLYRLSARRFLQELFDDLDFSKMLEEPRVVLGTKDNEEEKPRMETIKQNSIDSPDSFV